VSIRISCYCAEMRDFWRAAFDGWVRAAVPSQVWAGKFFAVECNLTRFTGGEHVTTSMLVQVRTFRRCML
jgi:hypothetical protein